MKAASVRKRVLLVDYSNSEIATDVPLLFKRAGCVVDAFCSPRSWVLKSGRIDTVIDAGGLFGRDFVARLEDLAASGLYDWVVPVDDEVLYELTDHLSDLGRTLGILPLSKLENAGVIGSKAGLHLLCKKYGIPSPRGAVLDDVVADGGGDAHAAAEALFDQVPFPLLLKVDRSAGGGGVSFCRNREEACTHLSRLREDQKKNILAQEYIRGDNVAAEALFHSGNLLAFSSACVLGNIGGEFSVSKERMYRHYPGMEKLLREIGSKFGIHGFCSMTFLFDRARQQFFLVEADMRPHAWFSFVRAAGIDFSAAVSRFLSIGPASLAENDPSDRGNRSNQNGRGDRGARKEGLPAGSFFPKEKKPLAVWHFPRTIFFAVDHSDVAEIARWILNRKGRWASLLASDPRLIPLTLKRSLRAAIFRVYNSESCALFKHAYRRVRKSEIVRHTRHSGV